VGVVGDFCTESWLDEDDEWPIPNPPALKLGRDGRTGASFSVWLAFDTGSGGIVEESRDFGRIFLGTCGPGVEVLRCFSLGEL
jgi:hypothetical protein